DVLAVRRGGEDDVAVAARECDDLGRDVLRELLGQLRRIGQQYLGHAGDLARRVGCTLGVVPGHQHMDLAARLLRGGDGVEGRTLQGAMVVFGNDESGHDQITLASFLSLATRVATSGTLMPALRLGGSLTLRVFRRDATSTPRS